MTILLKKELEDLQIQSRQTARQAAMRMKEKYYDGHSFLDMTRSMDIGLYNGFVTPVLAPGICEGTEPKPYPVPTLAALKKYGFTMKLEIDPKEFESGKILKLIYPDGGGKKVRPAEHLPIVMNYIEKDARKQGFAVIPHEPATVSAASVSPSRSAAAPPNL